MNHTPLETYFFHTKYSSQRHYSIHSPSLQINFISLTISSTSLFLSYLQLLQLLKGEEEHAVEGGEAADVWNESAIERPDAMLHVDVLQELH